LTRKDPRLFFFPWFADPGYRMNARDVVIPPSIVEYGRRLNAHLRADWEKGGRKGRLQQVDDDQLAWYTKESDRQQGKMPQEYPGTPEEAFAASKTGEYYAPQMTKMREQRRLTKVPFDPSVPVHTIWDLGISDYMSIGFVQWTGRECHLIDYYENVGEGFEHYWGVLQEKKRKRGFIYGVHVAPHDIRARELTTGKSRLRTAAEKLGLHFKVCKMHGVQDGINEVRRFLNTLWVDEGYCEKWVAHMDAYHKKWSEITQDYSDTPVHDEHSHCADMSRVMAMSVDIHMGAGPEGWGDGQQGGTPPALRPTAI
jgi:hypothetical protein